MEGITEAEAIDLTIELWTWLAETGKKKEDWPGWERYGGLDQHGECKEVDALCFLCEYNYNQPSSGCSPCPYSMRFGICYHDGTPFSKWEGAQTSKTRKKYAQRFLEQMNQLKEVAPES